MSGDALFPIVPTLMLIFFSADTEQYSLITFSGSLNCQSSASISNVHLVIQYQAFSIGSAIEEASSDRLSSTSEDHYCTYKGAMYP